MNIVIDSQFQDLLVPLTADERRLLEESIGAEGCRDPLVVWPTSNDTAILIDGHNRFEICERLGLDYETTEREFASRDEAELWIIRNQLGRRNLSDYQRTEYALRIKPVIAKQAKANQGKRTDIPENSPECLEPIETREAIAKVAGVSSNTVRKVERIIEHGTPEVKKAATEGRISIHRASKIVELTAAEQDDAVNQANERKPVELVVSHYKLTPDRFDALLKWTNELVDYVHRPEHRRSITGLHEIAERGLPLVQAATAVRVKGV